MRELLSHIKNNTSCRTGSIKCFRLLHYTMYTNKLQVNLDLSVNDCTALLSGGCESTRVRKCSGKARAPVGILRVYI